MALFIIQDEQTNAQAGESSPKEVACDSVGDEMCANVELDHSADKAERECQRHY